MHFFCDEIPNIRADIRGMLVVVSYAKLHANKLAILTFGGLSH